MSLSQVEAKPQRQRQLAIPYVFAELPRCPECGSTRLKAYKTVGSQGDDSVLRYSRCQICGTRCKIIFE